MKLFLFRSAGDMQQVCQTNSNIESNRIDRNRTERNAGRLLVVDVTPSARTPGARSPRTLPSVHCFLPSVSQEAFEPSRAEPAGCLIDGAHPTATNWPAQLSAGSPVAPRVANEFKRVVLTKWPAARAGHYDLWHHFRGIGWKWTKKYENQAS